MCTRVAAVCSQSFQKGARKVSIAHPFIVRLPLTSVYESALGFLALYLSGLGVRSCTRVTPSSTVCSLPYELKSELITRVVRPGCIPGDTGTRIRYIVTCKCFFDLLQSLNLAGGDRGAEGRRCFRADDGSCSSLWWHLLLRQRQLRSRLEFLPRSLHLTVCLKLPLLSRLRIQWERLRSDECHG